MSRPSPSLALVFLLAALAGACSRQHAEPAAARAPADLLAALEQAPPASHACLVFGASTTPAQQVRFFAIDPQTRAAALLGAPLAGTSVAGLAIHPASKVLHALLADGAGAGGHYLARVDRATGAVTRVGATGLSRAAGLAVRPSDGALYTWEQGRGPAVIDAATGAATVVASSSARVTDLAWDPAGAILYAASEQQLLAFDVAAGWRSTRSLLPTRMGGLAMRGDGQLLLTGPAPQTGVTLPDAPPGLASPFSLLIFDPVAGTTSATVAVTPIAVDPAHPLPDLAASRVESLSWAVSCGNPSAGGRADLIESLAVEPRAVCPGESVHVLVQARHPEGGANPVLVLIGGLPGADRWIQLDGKPGSRIVSVVALTAEGYVDAESATVEVGDCGPLPPLPRVRVRADPYRAYVANLEVVNAAEVAPPGSRFRWELGDGTQEEGTAPFVRHPYEASIPRDAEFPSFDAAVTLLRPDGTSSRVPVTVTLGNAYAADRRRGLVRPPATLGTAPPPAPGAIGIRSITPATRTLTVTNVEDAPIVLSRVAVEHQPCDPDVPRILHPWQALDVTLAARATWSHAVPVPADEAICGIGVHVQGSAGALRRVAVDVYEETRRNPFLLRRVSDSNTLAALRAAVTQGLAPEGRVDDERLFELSRAHLIPLPGNGAYVPAPPPPEPDPVVGTPCLPEDPAPHPGVTCQPTDEWDVAPPHIRNALKGDVVIGAACGFVGDLLRSVWPAQVYSHSGIMTRNHYEITHSTAADTRYPDYPYEGGELTDGIDEPVLKYGWPGIIRQPVEDAFRSVQVADPGGKPYHLHGFTHNPVKCPDDEVITLPKVIRPPPGAAATVRATLESAADLAIAASATLDQVAAGAQAGHYRLYAYTDTSIALKPEYDWNGPATMCSGFVWRSLKLAGATLEGEELESEDWALGARVNLSPLPDGLYAYDENERYAAGRFIHDFLYDTAFTAAGWFGDLLTDASDQLANQFTNCFAFDRCNYDATNSEAWQSEAGEGRAVSPQDILFWDSPETGGVYGSDEPLVYRSGENVRRYAWARSEGAGDIRGRVTYQGVPVEGARLILYVPAEQTTTREIDSAADGTFKFLAVPGGTYELRGQKPDGAFYLEKLVLVDVPAGGTANVELALEPPPEYLRRLVFEGSVRMLDKEPVGESDVDTTYGFFAACSVDPFAPEAWTDPDPWLVEPCHGEEVVVKVWIQCLLAEDQRSVIYTVTAKLWEQTDCDPTDIEDTDYPSGRVGPGESAPLYVYLYNDEDGGGDYAEFNLTVRNEQQ